MWMVTGQAITMVEGDFGIQLPIAISGTTFTANDEVKFTLKRTKNGETVISKTFSNITHNTVNLELTEQESESLSVMTYVYSLDWYQDGNFMCNIIPSGTLKVVDKA